MIWNKEIEELVKRKRYRQINSILLWQDGTTIGEFYNNGYHSESRNVIRSVAKSIVSLGVGIALDKGLIGSVDDLVSKYLPEFKENRDYRHNMMTIRHLLTMSSGILWNGGIHYHCPMMNQLKRSDNWISHIADCAVRDVPGTVQLYKEWDMILLTQVLSKACGDAFDFINDNLYKPLDIKSGRWYQSKCGTYYSVALDDELEKTSNLTAMEMLHFGILAYNGGVWDGKQIVSKEYLLDAITPSSLNKNYGYLWWVGDHWYGCRGYGGQSITVVPEKKAIVVTQATPTSRGMDYSDVVFEMIDLL
jgi:CubicO group peptidase (beta-lactamase class C family)